MHIVIDMTRLELVAKNPNRIALVCFVHIECGGVATSMGNIEELGASMFSGWTLLECQLLYKHLTGGVSLPGYWKKSAAEALVAAINRAPVTDIDEVEARWQASKVPSASKSHYKYVRGSQTPTIPQDLFLPVEIKVAPEPSDLVLAKTPVYDTPVAPPPGGYSLGVAAPVSAPRTPRTPRTAPANGEGGTTPALPGAGTLTARIYAFCNEQVAIDKEKGTNIPIDTIRKGCAKALIEQGVNASTARRQTMEWMNSL